MKFVESQYIKDVWPKKSVLTVRQKEETELFPSNWGIRFKPDSEPIFNSRIETIKEKPFWYNSFKSKREHFYQ